MIRSSNNSSIITITIIIIIAIITISIKFIANVIINIISIIIIISITICCRSLLPSCSKVDPRGHAYLLRIVANLTDDPRRIPISSARRWGPGSSLEESMSTAVLPPAS